MPAAAGQGETLEYVGEVSFSSSCRRWDYNPSGYGYPYVGLVVTGDTGCAFPAEAYTYNGQEVVPARPFGTILMHPGPSNEHAQMQWRAPISGRAVITGLVYPVDQTANHDAGISVFRNSVLLLRLDCAHQSLPFSLSVDLLRNDVITFGIDWGDNGNYGWDLTGLDAAIVYSASATPSARSMPSTSPYCMPSLFRSLPRMDLVGALVGTALSPGSISPVPSLEACRQSCCDAAACDGYSFASGDASLLPGGSGVASCFLYVNITQLVPSSGYSSGIYESTL